MEHVNVTNPKETVEKKEEESFKGSLFATITFVGSVIVLMWGAIFWLFVSRF